MMMKQTIIQLFIVTAININNVVGFTITKISSKRNSKRMVFDRHHELKMSSTDDNNIVANRATVNLSNRASEQQSIADSESVASKNRSNDEDLEDEENDSSMKESGDFTVRAKVNTVNQRLLDEIQRSTDEQNAPKTKTGKKSKELFSSFQSQKTDEERQRSIDEARNLNGVNPAVALGASVVAFVGAGFLWYCTGYLAALFAAHPITTEVYSLQRLFAVFRNAVMGLFSLASGFFGVTGLGLFLLGVRVAYGVITGELDPTPIKRRNPLTGMPESETKIPNIWDFMTGKKSKDGSNPFL